MSTHKHIDAICLIILVFTLLATVLFMNGESYGIQKISDGDYIDENSSLYFTENELMSPEEEPMPSTAML